MKGATSSFLTLHYTGIKSQLQYSLNKGQFLPYSQYGGGSEDKHFFLPLHVLGIKSTSPSSQSL